MNQFRKVSGVVLIAFGVAIIGYSFFSSWQIFTGTKESPKIFSESLQAQQRQENLNSSSSATTEDLLSWQLQIALQEEFGSRIPQNTVPRMLNLVAWSLFASILLFGGSQLAGVGIKLLKA